MTRKVHITVQSILQSLQVFISFPGLSISHETQTMIHAVIAAVTVLLAGVSQEFNTDGTRQEAAYLPPSSFKQGEKGGQGEGGQGK